MVLYDNMELLNDSIYFMNENYFVNMIYVTTITIPIICIFICSKCQIIQNR